MTAACHHHHHRHQRFCIQTFSLQPILSTILVNCTISFRGKEVLGVGILVIFEGHFCTQFVRAIVSFYPADSPVIVPVTISLHQQRVTSQHSSFRPSSFLSVHSPSEGPHLRLHNWDITTSLQIMALVMAAQLSDIFHFCTMKM